MSAGAEPFAVDPFGPSANPSAYVPNAASERARDALAAALEASRVAALVGTPGVGKTLLLRLTGAAQQERARVAYLPIVTFEPDDFFALALHELGAPSEAAPRAALRTLAERLTARGGVLLLVDDAHAMPDATARSLAELVAETGGSLRVALAALEGPRADRVCAAFGDGLERIRFEEGLAPGEVRAYVEARLGYAGARPDLVAAFDDAAIADLHAQSQGVPRELNRAAQAIVRRRSGAESPAFAGSRVAPARPAPVPEQAAPRVEASPGDPAGAYRIAHPRAEPAPPPKRVRQRPAPPPARQPEPEPRPMRRSRWSRASLARLPILPTAGVALAVATLGIGLWTISGDDDRRVSESAPAAAQAEVGPAPADVDPPDEAPGAEQGAVEPAPSPAEPARTTTIAINATPWATIEVDGRSLGETPLANVELEVGPHRFRAIMPDGSVRDQLIEIRHDVRTVVFE